MQEKLKLPLNEKVTTLLTIVKLKKNCTTLYIYKLFKDTEKHGAITPKECNAVLSYLNIDENKAINNLLISDPEKELMFYAVQKNNLITKEDLNFLTTIC